MPVINAISPSRPPRRFVTLFASAVIVGGLFAALPTVAQAWCGTNDCTGYDRAVSAVTVVHEDPGLTTNTPVEPDTDSQTFTATDSTFDCVYSCAAASGPTMSITYSP